MFRKFTTILTVVFVLSFCLNALAVERAQRLKLELGGDFSFSYDNYDQFGVDQGSLAIFSLTPRMGFFISRHFQVEPEFSVEWISLETPTSDRELFSLGLLLRGVYNIMPHERIFPFVFVGMGMTENSDSNGPLEATTFAVPELGIGVKSFITKGSAIRLALKYVHEENSLGDDDLEANSLRISAGFSVFLGK